MGSKKAPKHATSNTSARANPGAPVAAQSASQSSVLKSSFAPYRLNTFLFATVIQGLDSQHIRIHETNSGRLCSEHATTPNTTINCLDWGILGNNGTDAPQIKSTKKRKRSSESNGVTPAADIVLAFGTSRSEIHIFSPTESKILKTLKDVHLGGIRDFKFQNDGHGHQAYSVGGDGKVVQWDLKSQTATMTMTLPNGPATAIRPTESKIICASHSAHILDSKSMTWSSPYNVSTNNVHTVLIKQFSLNEDLQFMTIAEADHFINVFDDHSFLLNGSLRTENEIMASDLWSLDGHSKVELQELPAPNLNAKQTLVILNKDGVLELFPEPFEFGIDSSGAKSDSLKARMKQRSRKSVAQIRIVRSSQVAAQVPLINVSFQKNEIVVAWVEGGINVHFDILPWRDAETGSLLLNGYVEIVKEKSGSGLGAVNMIGVKDMGRSHVDESQAVVVSAVDDGDISMDEAEPEVIDISSAEEEDDSEEDELITQVTALREDVEHATEDEERKENRVDSEDESMPDAQADEKSREVADSPSFGDLLRTNAPEPIHVSDALTDGNTQSLVPTNSTSLHTLPSGMSLGTVLTQSLRTNDTNLLETCLHTRDLSTVRSTIERLDSSFATDLLQRLAERLHSRPGRAGSLMVWIQWTLVAHGGYLAGQPEVLRKLKSLHKVVKERAGSLQNLLNLKGKLDMLEAQMNLRRSVLEKGKNANKEYENEEAVIYVEGQETEEDDSVSGENSDESGEHSKREASLGDNQEDDSEGDIEDTPLAISGVPADPEDVSDSDEDSMAGDEPSDESDRDSEEDLDNEDVDHASADTESSDGEALHPRTQPQARLTNGSRA